MFWKYNTSSSSQIEGLLGKEDVTLQEVMDADDIINECRAQNKTLIDFLLKPDVMEELVTLTIKEPSIEIEERSRFKYPNIASELLTCDVPALNETLAGNEVLLDKLYSFLECDPPLNPLLASYFSKIMGALIAKKTEQNWLSYQFTCLQVLDFLKAKDTFISLLLKHLGTSAIMDLMLKLMTQVEGVEMRQNILNWLDSQRIMQSLVSLLNPKIDKERHYNVAQLLCDFVRIARDTQRNSTERADPDPLLNTLESPETVALLLDHILKEEKSETAIAGGIQVLLALLDVYQSSIPKFNSQNMYNSNINEEASDIEQKQKIIFNTTRAFCARAKDFHNILLDPPNTTPIVTTVGTLNPPLGNTRLQITKLLATVIASNNEELLNELESIGTFPVLLDLFFKYPWNNFLHTQVENCLISALKTHVSEEIDDTNALTKHLLVNCKLIERILGAWKENDEQQAQEKGIRQGYMGHLISIVNKIVDLCSNTALGQYLKDNLPDVAKTLNDFKDTTLSETNKIQETLLGGAHPNSSVEDNDDYGDIPFPQSSALQQQMFSQYQMQNLTSQYIDGYSGFNDDAFNDGDDTLQTIDHRTDMNFDLSEGDLVQQHEIFKQVCAQNINTLDDADDQIFEDRDHTFQTVIEKQDRNEAVYSSDSDDEQGGDENMDVDPWSSPKPVESRPARAVGSDPWGSDFGSSDATVGGWADFSSAQFDANFASFDGKIKKNGNKENKQPIVESDLKLESIDSQTDNSKDSKTNSIDKVAQVEDVKSEGPDTIKSAAGDQGGELVSGHQKTSSAAVTEPSKSKEGDHTLQSGSTGKEKVEKDKV
uniref:Serine/threonine-protein phosphatase 6 regulatory subunit 3 n=1 Tax=Anoplophora glabripennis TaxID=217634 RepID=V5G4U0_ANOGL